MGSSALSGHFCRRPACRLPTPRIKLPQQRQVHRALAHQEVVEGGHGRRDRAVGAHHHEPLPADRHADHVEDDQPAGFDFGRDGVSRDEGDAQSGHHRLLDRLVGAHLDAEIVDAAGQLAEEISSEMRVPEPGSRMRKCSSAMRSLEMSRFFDQRVVGRRDDHQRMIAEGRGAQRHVLGRPAHQRDVDIVVLQVGDGLGAVADRGAACRCRGIPS